LPWSIKKRGRMTPPTTYNVHYGMFLETDTFRAGAGGILSIVDKLGFEFGGSR
jgi:hypothetical protein